MASFRPREMLKLTRNVNQVVRSFTSKQTSGNYGYRNMVPLLFGGATLAGSAFVAWKNEYEVGSFIPQVHASPPPPKANIPMERTFIMIKPDGVKRGLVADIIKRFEQRGYKLVAMKMMKADDELLNEHYGDLKTKPFFPGLIKHITSGPVVAMVWEGKNVVKQGRQMLGETNPLTSKPGSIRGDYSIDMGRNIIHGSDSVDSANAEIELWFKEGELMDYQLPLHDQVFE